MLKFIFMLLLINTITCQEDENYFEIPIKITQGVYWKELTHNVVYESSAPLLYEGYFPPYDLQMENNKLADVACDVPPSDWCKFATWLDTVDKNIAIEILKCNTNYHSDLHSDDTNIINRQKRGIDFIASVLNFCCSVATESEFKSLYSGQNQLAQKIEDIKLRIHDDHIDLLSVSEKMEGFTHSMRLAITGMQQNFSIYQRNLLKNINAADTQNNKYFYSLFQATERIARRLYETINLIRRKDIISDCRNKHIPASVIPAHILKHDLQLLRNKTLPNKYDIAIPINELTWYYKLKIAECQISQNKILIKL
jgi:hypothetical protein